MSDSKVAPNLSIPGRMNWDELKFLGELARSVPAGGRIVEVGPLYGRSTYTMASFAPNVQITSIDAFENAPWIESYRQGLKGKVPAFGLEAFKQYTGKFDNVSAIEGYSPHVVSDWSEPIDMYFEDATHGNPNLLENIEFWTSHLKPGGIACGHDYSLRFPDVKQEVDRLAQRWGSTVEIVNSLWAIRRPIGDNAPAKLLQTGIAPIHDGPLLKIHTKNRHKGESFASSGYWVGSHMSHDPLYWLRIDVAEKLPDLDLEYRVRGANGIESEWSSIGQKANLFNGSKGIPIWDFAARLRGEGSLGYKVIYRVAHRQKGNNGYRYSGVTDWVSDGKWAKALRSGAHACSIAVAIARRVPPSSQPDINLLSFHAAKSVLQRVRRKFF